MQQKEALEILKLGYHVFLTGEAGTGKTFVLNKYIQFLKKRKIPTAITASTGIAATHLDGVTIDSWSGLGIRDDITNKEIQELSYKHHVRHRIEAAKVIIIDEISMIPAQRFDAYDRILRTLRKNGDPFGGLQVILSGDLFQLPPVTNTAYIDYIFKSRAWQELDLKVCYLDVAKRQTDREFLQILRDIRYGQVTDQTHRTLSQTIHQNIPGGFTRLYTHNIDVDSINRQELEKIKSDEHRSTMTSVGPDQLITMMKRTCLAPEQLVLKKSALVMFVRNNFQKGYFNGTLGKIIGFNRNGFPIVKTFENQKIEVETAEWTISEDEKIVAQIRQIPLRLAWAITIHKSQGMTLDAAEIDLSKSFVEGMGYVALSRVKSLKRLRLLGINDMALKVNPEITEVDKELIRESQQVSKKIKKMSWFKRWLTRRKSVYKLTS